MVCRVQGSGCRVQGSGFKAQGSGLRVPQTDTVLAHRRIEKQVTVSGLELASASAQLPGAVSNSNGVEHFNLKWLKPRPESGLDWLVCSTFAPQRTVTNPRRAIGAIGTIGAI